MKNLKIQKGITLIALIITIIVMLILVGVTINVALNGGLFEKAKTAADGTQKQAEKEELMAAAFGTVDTKGDLQIKKSALESVLSQGWEIDDENTITDNNNQIWYTCTSPKGNTYYLNTTTGEIRETEPTSNPNQSQEFSWDTVNLGRVDTTKEYTFAGFAISFSSNGICSVGYEGQTPFDTVDATDSTKFKITNDNKFSYNSEEMGTVIISVRQDGDLDVYVSGGGTINGIPADTYQFEKDAVIGKYVYYNYDGNNATSIWKVVGKGNDGNIKIVNTQAIGNINLPITSTVSDAVEAWNSIPTQVTNALNLVTETTFRNGSPECNTPFASGTTTITLDSTQYTVNSYNSNNNSGVIAELYHQSGSDMLNSIFLRNLRMIGNQLYVQVYETSIYNYSSAYISNAVNPEDANVEGCEIKEFTNMGIGIVVTLKSGVTLDKTSGAGTYASPYELTNSGS